MSQNMMLWSRRVDNIFSVHSRHLDHVLNHSSIVVMYCLLMACSLRGSIKIQCLLQLGSMQTVNWCLLHLPSWRRRTSIVGIGLFVLFEKWLSIRDVRFV
jgi:hypothetical protein